MIRVPENILEFGEEGLLYHDGKPFTGSAFREADDGRLMYEAEYRGGRQWGICREWYADGQLSSEESFALEYPHGMSRQWHGNGQLANEAMYELGVCLEKKEWDEAENQVKDYRLSESDPDYRTLLARRKQLNPILSGSDQ
jgi:antitoxin component YwqK of YwqJK toxin-antitoxin module